MALVYKEELIYLSISHLSIRLSIQFNSSTQDSGVSIYTLVLSSSKGENDERNDERNGLRENMEESTQMETSSSS